MYKKLNLFRGIKSFEPWFNYGLLADNSIINLLTGKTLKNKIDLSRVISSKEQVLFLDDLNRPYRLILENEELDDTLSTRFRVFSALDEYIIYYKKGNVTTYGIWNSNDEKSLCEVQSYIGEIIFGDFIYGEINKTIICRSIKTGERKWSVNIAEIGHFDHPNEVLRNDVSVQQFIGIYDDMLWIFLRNRIFLGIDINTGVVSRIISRIQHSSHLNKDYPPDFPENMLSFFLSAVWFMDKELGIIKGIVGFCYYEINVNTKFCESNKSRNFISLFLGEKGIIKDNKRENEVRVWYFYTEMRELGLKEIAPRISIIDDTFERIYFTNGDVGRWGIFNTRTFRFDYVSEPIKTDNPRLRFD